VTPVSSFALNIVTGAGLGLGIDYSLLLLSASARSFSPGRDRRPRRATDWRRPAHVALAPSPWPRDRDARRLPTRLPPLDVSPGRLRPHAGRLISADRPCAALSWLLGPAGLRPRRAQLARAAESTARGASAASGNGLRTSIMRARARCDRLFGAADRTRGFPSRHQVPPAWTRPCCRRRQLARRRGGGSTRSSARALARSPTRSCAETPPGPGGTHSAQPGCRTRRSCCRRIRRAGLAVFRVSRASRSSAARSQLLVPRAPRAYDAAFPGSSARSSTISTRSLNLRSPSACSVRSAFALLYAADALTRPGR